MSDQDPSQLPRFRLPEEWEEGFSPRQRQAQRIGSPVALEVPVELARLAGDLARGRSRSDPGLERDAGRALVAAGRHAETPMAVLATAEGMSPHGRRHEVGRPGFEALVAELGLPEVQGRPDDPRRDDRLAGGPLTLCTWLLLQERSCLVGWSRERLERALAQVDGSSVGPEPGPRSERVVRSLVEELRSEPVLRSGRRALLEAVARDLRDPGRPCFDTTALAAMTALRCLAAGLRELAEELGAIARSGFPEDLPADLQAWLHRLSGDSFRRARRLRPALDAYLRAWTRTSPIPDAGSVQPVQDGPLALAVGELLVAIGQARALPVWLGKAQSGVLDREGSWYWQAVPGEAAPDAMDRLSTLVAGNERRACAGSRRTRSRMSAASARFRSLEQAVERDPGDQAAWGALAAAAHRSGWTPELLEDEALLPWLFRAWRSHPTDPGLVGLLLPRVGLGLPEDDQDEPGEAWLREGRAVLRDGRWVDSGSGLPLRYRRLADGAEMVLVPDREPLLIDRFPVRMAAFQALGVATPRSMPLQDSDVPERFVYMVDRGTVMDFLEKTRTVLPTERELRSALFGPGEASWPATTGPLRSPWGLEEVWPEEFARGHREVTVENRDEPGPANGYVGVYGVPRATRFTPRHRRLRPAIRLLSALAEACGDLFGTFFPVRRHPARVDLAHPRAS